MLKGDDTLVVAPGGRVAVSRGGAPALATAGTGDVLSGVIGAMLAKGLPAAHAACAGVYAHVRAGQIAAAPHGPDGVIASDVIYALPAALAALRCCAAMAADGPRHHGDRRPVVLPGTRSSRVLKVMRDARPPRRARRQRGRALHRDHHRRRPVMAGENEDLHLPHYFELFGGFVFLESMSHFEERLRKAFAVDRGAT